MISKAIAVSLALVGASSACSSNGRDGPSDPASSASTSSVGGDGAGVAGTGGAPDVASTAGPTAGGDGGNGDGGNGDGGNGDGGNGDGGNGDGGNGDGGGHGGHACVAAEPDIPPWHPPRTADPACESGAIDDYWDACLRAESIPIDCQQTTVANETCVSCLLSAASDAEWGPLVEVPGAVVVNRGGCIALVTGDDTAEGCGALRHEADACILDGCSQCPGNDCEEVASAGVCESRVDAACPSDPAWEACQSGATPFDRYRAVATAFCGEPAID